MNTVDAVLTCSLGFPKESAPGWAAVLGAEVSVGGLVCGASQPASKERESLKRSRAAKK